MKIYPIVYQSVYVGLILLFCSTSHSAEFHVSVAGQRCE